LSCDHRVVDGEFLPVISINTKPLYSCINVILRTRSSFP
jgi:hypothetical protein